MGADDREASGMTITRVALLDMKPRLHNILTDAIEHVPELELVDWETGPVEAKRRPRPEVLILEVADPRDPAVPLDLLNVEAGARILLISSSGAEATIHQLRVDCGLMENVAIDQLLEAIRYGVESRAASGTAL
jgi:hypothetical protein